MTKLLFRRWYLSLPMLVACLVVVIVASQTVQPDYSATGHVQLIPPPGTTAPDGQQNPIKNPWFDLGYVALSNAAVIDVSSKSVLEQMVADGLSDNVTIALDRAPLIDIEVVGHSPEQATASVQRVMALLAKAVEQRQASLRVAHTDVISTLALDDGSEVQVKTSKLTRILVVAGGVGLLLTAGVTIGVDALLRRRDVRRGRPPAAQGVGGPDPTGPRPQSRSGISPGPSVANPDAIRTSVVAKGPSDSEQAAAGQPTEPVRRRVPMTNGVPGNGASGNEAPSKGMPAQGPVTQVRYEYQVTEFRPVRGGRQDEPVLPSDATTELAGGSVPADATIILPLSNAKWAREDRNDKR